jgi:regulator of sirC expression with transglutaminase-like and TPR domain
MFDTVASGEPLDDDDVLRLVTSSTGREVDGLEPAHLARASSRDMLARMSRNLRRCYTSLECWDQALRAADRCVDLLPSAPAERRDRGLLLWRMGRIVAALVDINSYLDEAAETCADRPAMTEVAGRLRAFLN